MTMVSRSIIIGSVVPAVCVVLFGMLLYSPALPGPNPPGHFYEHLTRGQALMVEILPAGAGCIIPGAIIEKSRKTPGFSQGDIRLRAFPKARYFGCRV